MAILFHIVRYLFDGNSTGNSSTVVSQKRESKRSHEKFYGNLQFILTVWRQILLEIVCQSMSGILMNDSFEKSMENNYSAYVPFAEINQLPLGITTRTELKFSWMSNNFYELSKRNSNWMFALHPKICWIPNSNRRISRFWIATVNSFFVLNLPCILATWFIFIIGKMERNTVHAEQIHEQQKMRRNKLERNIKYSGGVDVTAWYKRVPASKDNTFFMPTVNYYFFLLVFIFVHLFLEDIQFQHLPFVQPFSPLDGNI